MGRDEGVHGAFKLSEAGFLERVVAAVLEGHEVLRGGALERLSPGDMT
jgi:hypothetical protein